MNENKELLFLEDQYISLFNDLKKFFKKKK